MYIYIYIYISGEPCYTSCSIYICFVFKFLLFIFHIIIFLDKDMISVGEIGSFSIVTLYCLHNHIRKLFVTTLFVRILL